MEARIGLVVSPRSRKNRGNDHPFSPFGGHCKETRGAPRTRDELRDLLESFRRNDVQTIAVSGGDGTLHLVISECIPVFGAENLPTFAILRGGTMNTVANGIRSPRGEQGKLLERLRAGLGAGTNADAKKPRWGAGPIRTVRKRTLAIYTDTTDASGRRTEHVEHGFLFGTGAISGFLAEYYRAPDPNPWVAARVLTRGAVSAATFGRTAERIVSKFNGTISFELAGGQEASLGPASFAAIAAGTVPELGLGFQPFSRATLDAFHGFAFHGAPIDIARELPKIRFARPLAKERASEYLAIGMRLQAERPFRYMIDGDLRDAKTGKLHVRLGPIVGIVVGF
jgi:diacylglycerol kinase (ATP)